MFGVSCLAGMSAMTLGLLVSAIARTQLQAIQIVPLVILPQIMLSGILLPVAGDKATPIAVWLSQPILLRWGYSASVHVEFAETTQRGQKALGIGGANYWERLGFPKPGTEGLFGNALMTDLVVMGSLGLACVLLTWLILVVRDRR